MVENSYAQRTCALRRVFITLLSFSLAFAMCIPCTALAAEPEQTDEALAEADAQEGQQAGVAEQVLDETSDETADEASDETADEASNEVRVLKKQAATLKADGEDAADGQAADDNGGTEGGADESGDNEADATDTEPISLANAKLTLEAKTFTYDKKKHKPAVTVTLDSKALAQGTDYTVSYASCKKVGTATATVKGKGDYTGTKTATYTIRPMGTTFRDVITRTTTKMHVRWAVQSKQTTGYELEWGKTKKLKSGTKTVTVANPTANETTVKGLKAKTVYYARVRTYTKIDGETYYSKWSRILSVGKFDKARQAKAVPVLTYHRICSDKAKKRFYGIGLAISETNFRKQMRWLSEHGYHGVSMAEFIDWYHNGAYLPKKSILITIDDGFYETYWVARPILKRYGQKATNFVIGTRTPSKTVAYNQNSDRNHYVGRDVIFEANNTLDCLKYESHTYNMHSKGSRERPYLQMWTQKRINADFDTMDETYGFSALAYPFGYCNSKAYKACKRSKDIKVAFTYKTKNAARRSSPKYRLPRFKVNGNKSWTSVMSLAGTYR